MLFRININKCIMIKCKISVEKTYLVGKKELKTLHTLELDKEGLEMLCKCVSATRASYDVVEIRRLISLFSAY